MKVIYFAAVVAALAVTDVTGASTKSKGVGILEEHPIDWYDCGGKADGNYESPRRCTEFISCSGGVASQRECPDCHQDPVSCPDGQLVYNLTRNECVWAHETTCGSGGGGGGDPEPTEGPEEPGETTEEGPSPTEAPENPDPEEPELPPGLPKPGDSCTEEKCNITGWCTWFYRCKDGIIVQEECGNDMGWNPVGAGPDGACDLWDNIPEDTRDEYYKSRLCLECFWEELGECNAEYLYQAPDLRRRKVDKYTCPAGLVFVYDKRTCQRCEEATKKNGDKCC